MPSEQRTDLRAGLRRRWKRTWLRLLADRLGRRRPAGPLEWRTGPCRILFLRYDRIGDAIVTSGVLHAIATASPNLRLDVLGSPRNEAILRRVPGISEVRVLDRKRPLGMVRAIRRLRSARYDAVIDCMVTAPSVTTLLLMSALGARHRVGVAGRGIDSALTVPVAPARGDHQIDLLGALAAYFTGEVGPDVLHPRLELEDREVEGANATWRRSVGDSGLRVLVNVSAGKTTRSWPEERWVAVIRGLVDAHHPVGVIVIGAPTESDKVERIATASGAVAVPTPHIGDVLALVATAGFVLTPDTSIVHMASAVRTPAVAMYPKDMASLWGLYGTMGANVEGEGASLDSLPIGPVADAVDSVIERVRATIDDAAAPERRSSGRRDPLRRAGG